jgi:hypothetical protein
MFACAQEEKVDRRVDSLFSKNFAEIKPNNFYPKQKLSKSNIQFLRLFSFLSGMELQLTPDYIGLPVVTYADLDKRHQWYNINKHKISWENHILAGFDLIDKLDTCHTEADYEGFKQSLHNLQIK